MNAKLTQPVHSASVLDPVAKHKEPGTGELKNKKAQHAATSQGKEKSAATMEKKQPQGKADEVSEYLKSISRLENKLKKNEVSDEDLGKLMEKLEEKIKSLTPQQKKALKKMEFFMQGSLENLKDFKGHLTKMLKDPPERGKALEFLKDPRFMALMEDKKEEPLAQGYGPQAKTAPSPSSKEVAGHATVREPLKNPKL